MSRAERASDLLWVRTRDLVGSLVMGLRILSTMALAVLVVADAGHARAEPGDDLTVVVLTFGPGDHPFFKFGHNAILVQPNQESGLVYNFGTFAFDSPALIPKFLQGRFKYWLSVSHMEDTFASYVSENRTIEAQELDLTPAQKWALWQSLRENARPENREYLYDYFRDNCSTRVRDVVDRAVGGRVRQAGQRQATMTFRADALRMTADFFPEYLGLDLGLGRLTDAPITLWEEAFLPERMRDLLREVRIPGESGEKPLVKSERTLFAAHRPPKPDRPPHWNAYFLVAGLALGAFLAGLGRLAGNHPAARVGLGISASLLGIVFGLLGLILLSFWLFTDHKAAYANANIFLLAPWSVVLAGGGVGTALGRPASVRKAFWVVATAAGFAAIGVIAKAFPGVSQDNLALVAFLLPVWMGLVLGFRWALRRS
jgi:hypothetical protein